MTNQSDLLTVALVRYADACPPERHPDCPFVVASNVGRTCERQCRDEITRLSKPGFTGVQAYSAAPYDPKRQLMSEPTPTPSEQWHTGSLLQMLLLLTMRPIHSDGTLRIQREVDITNALAMLARRGYDPDILLREGLAHALPTVLTLDVCSATLVADRSVLPAPTQDWVRRLERYMARLAVESEPAPSRGHLFALAQRSGFFNFVERWLAYAPMEDVVRWSPVDVPDASVLPNDGVARWMIERFAMASLTDWGVKSLHLEHGWVNGLSAPVGVEEMFLRNVPRTVLDREIARRAVQPRPQSLVELIHQALRLLNDGRRAEAAALFDAARIIDPTNAEAHNNFAFCITPDEPATALAALRESETLEEHPYPLNRVNQAVVLRLLDEPTEALAAAESAWSERAHFPMVGWLWCDWTKPGGPAVREVDPQKYLCELAIEVARNADDTEAEIGWSERLVEVSVTKAGSTQSPSAGPSSEA